MSLKVVMTSSIDFFFIIALNSLKKLFDQLEFLLEHGNFATLLMAFKQVTNFLL